MSYSNFKARNGFASISYLTKENQYVVLDAIFREIGCREEGVIDCQKIYKTELEFFAITLQQWCEVKLKSDLEKLENGTLSYTAFEKRNGFRPMISFLSEGAQNTIQKALIKEIQESKEGLEYFRTQFESEKDYFKMVWKTLCEIKLPSELESLEKGHLTYSQFKSRNGFATIIATLSPEEQYKVLEAILKEIKEAPEGLSDCLLKFCSELNHLKIPIKQVAGFKLPQEKQNLMNGTLTYANFKTRNGMDGLRLLCDKPYDAEEIVRQRFLEQPYVK